MKPLYLFLLFILAILVHELGHYVSYRLCRRKAFFKFNWWGIEAECEDRLTLTLRQYFWIGISGVSWGLIIISFSNDANTILVYLLACCIDFSIIFQIIQVPKKDRSMTLFEHSEKEYFKNKLEMKKTRELIKNGKRSKKLYT